MTNQQKPNSIINSLKRLERAGMELSRTNEKLRQAAQEVAERIVDIAYDEMIRLPWGYHVENRKLYAPYTDGFTTLEPIDSRTALPIIQKFARDVANGLLDAIAETIEQSAKANEATRKALLAQPATPAGFDATTNYTAALERLADEGFSIVKTNGYTETIDDHLSEIDYEWNPEVIIREITPDEMQLIEVMRRGYLSTGEPLATVYRAEFCRVCSHAGIVTPATQGDLCDTCAAQ